MEKIKEQVTNNEVVEEVEGYGHCTTLKTTCLDDCVLSTAVFTTND